MAAVLGRLTRVAVQHSDVCALALVGSWAYGAPGMDSDVDVVLLTKTPSAYIERDDRWEKLGSVQFVRTRAWGALTERRLRLRGGLEVDCGVGTPAWAAVDPVDEGTRKVASDGMTVLYDADRLLARLLETCGLRAAS